LDLGYVALSNLTDLYHFMGLNMKIEVQVEARKLHTHAQNYVQDPFKLKGKHPTTLRSLRSVVGLEA